MLSLFCERAFNSSCFSCLGCVLHFFSFFFKRTRLGHACRSVRGVASARCMSYTSMTLQMKCTCFLAHSQLHNFGTEALFVCLLLLYRKTKRVLELKKRITMSKTPHSRPIKQSLN